MRKQYLLAGLLILTACASGSLSGEYASLAEQMNTEHDKALIAPDAPWVTDEMKSPEHLAQFAEKVCRMPAEASARTQEQRDNCNKKLDGAFFARLNEKYFMATAAEVDQKCAAHPMECNEGHTYEAWARESHNAGVERSRAQKMAELKAASSAHQAYSYQRMGEAMRGLAGQLQGPRATNCTIMNTGGPTATMQCR